MSVNWPTGTQGLGAFHGAEVPFVFNDGFELMGGEHNLSDSMSTYWTNMASSGDPNTWQGPTAGAPPSSHPVAEPAAAAAAVAAVAAEEVAEADASGGGAASIRRQLQFGPKHKPNASAVRSPNATHWWHFPGAVRNTQPFPLPLSDVCPEPVRANHRSSDESSTKHAVFFCRTATLGSTNMDTAQAQRVAPNFAWRMTTAAASISTSRGKSLTAAAKLQAHPPSSS
jgi:hypothetical protein